MQAMIFAAGIGSRLRPFTDSHPKALAPVAGVPALERAIRFLTGRGGVSHIVVNVHHFACQVIDFIDGLQVPAAGIEVSDESGLLLDTGGGLLKALPMLEDYAERFPGNNAAVLHNADIVTDFNISEMECRFAESKADVLLLVSGRESSRQLWFDSDGRLRGWQNVKSGQLIPEDLDTSNLHPRAFGGVHIIRLDTIAPLLREYGEKHGAVFSMIPFYLDIMKQAEIQAFEPSAAYRWHDIGTPSKLATATSDFSLPSLS